jgi:hypothetical protein
MSTTSSNPETKPTHEQIAKRAEMLWKEKGSPSGQDETFWLEAERQLTVEAQEKSPTPLSSKVSSEDPNPQMGSQSSAAEEMKPPASAPRGNRRRSSGR